MSGIYLHIPFCRKACHYCDFHFSTSFKLKDDFLGALIKEIEDRKNELGNEAIKTIYFGGGTPSILERSDIERILKTIAINYKLADDLEITLEANPDDLTYEKLNCLKSAGINRLSIGIQSFFDEHLNWMNRSHSSEQAINCVKMAAELGFDNITIDLIYGIPKMTMEEWESNVHMACELPVHHISSYCLTVEPKTALAHQVKKGKVKMVDDDVEIKQFNFLRSHLKSNGFNQYEVSNFAKKGYISKHNSSYWKGETYLGFGPSAHSFNGVSRSWNVSNNPKYIKGIQNGNRDFETEYLELRDRLNERIMTGLRTVWGIDLEEIRRIYNYDFQDKNKVVIQELISKNEIEMEGSILRLSPKGFMRADRIASDFFVV